MTDQWFNYLEYEVGMAFELLLSADALVPDHDLALRRAQVELGIQRLSERQIVRSPEHRATWSFSRVHPDRGLAPTNIEFLQTTIPAVDTPVDPDYGFVPEIDAAQGDRPAKLHATPIGVHDLEEAIERLERTGGRFRLHEPTPLLPFRRLWVGYEHDGTGRYDPRTDGGLWLELVPATAHRLPADPGPPPPPRRDGTVIRIAARTILVADLDSTLRALERGFGIAPDLIATGPDGITRAVLPFGNPRSARVEVLGVGPSSHGFEADLLRRWGPGPCGIRFAVDGLDAFSERQRRLGLDVRVCDPLVEGQSRLFRPLNPVFGNVYEFIPWSGD